MITLAALSGHGEAHGEHHGPHEIRKPYDPAADAADEQYERTFHEKGENSARASDYRWGMTIDLDRCTGCSACIAACYVENNLPRVGEDETRLVRQMAWLRINRWAGEGEDELKAGRVQPGGESREARRDGHPQRAGPLPALRRRALRAGVPGHRDLPQRGRSERDDLQPLHRHAVLREQLPYKVRRFNYFDHQLTKWPAPMELGLNPDVTVRGQGVMEKCTFCVQRVQYARQEAKNAGRSQDPRRRRRDGLPAVVPLARHPLRQPARPGERRSRSRPPIPSAATTRCTC